MTKRERADPDLIIRSKSALSRQRRIARGSGREITDAKQFISEFQQMRTMMQKMASGQAPGGPGAAAPPDPAEGLNRAARRSKKKAKGKKKVLTGFG